MLKRLMASVGALALLMAAGEARAQAADDVEAVVVTVDPAGLLERVPSNTVFGIDKPLLETPRAATFVSDTTLQRYGITTIDDLVAISPSSYTSSFYGVPGSLNVRGTLAENYFRGFKRLENRGTYATPLGAAAQVEVVRGPPTPIFGSGKVGGLLNFTPKSGKMEGKYITETTGEVTLTAGSYNKKIFSAQGGVPLNFGDRSGGLYAYFDAEDSHSFYRGITPQRMTFQLSSDFDWGGGWSTSMGGMLYKSKGDVQTAGWNRLTQNLIDNQIYITGRDTDLKDTNNSGKIEPSEVGFYPFATALYLFGGTDAKHTLDTGVGTTKLSPRTVYIDRSDFSETFTGTFYFDINKELTATSGLKLQAFFDRLDNQRFVSYGFPASYQSHVGELRLTYDFALDSANGFVTSKSFVGLSGRTTRAHSRESFNSGLIALDRRDLSIGAQPNDIIDSPYIGDPPGSVGLGWENNVYTNSRQNGVFATTDVTIGGKLNLILGGRYDDYSVSSRELGGGIAFAPAYGRAGKGMGTYTAAVTYKLPYGFMPYYTYSKAAALEVGQASQVPTSLLANSNAGYLSDSYLSEAGIKFQLLNNTLVGSIAGYRQVRTRLTQGIGTVTVVGTRSSGFEAEIRWLATKNLSFTFAGNTQRTAVKGPDRSFVYLPASQFGVSPVNGFGGSYVSFDFSSIRGRGDYDYSIIPHSVASLYGSYTSDEKSWGRVGLTIGATHVSKTSTLLNNPIVYPAYWVSNLSAFYERGPYSVVVNVDNLTDKLYFTPDADSYANLGALPSVGREWRVTLKRSF